MEIIDWHKVLQTTITLLLVALFSYIGSLLIKNRKLIFSFFKKLFLLTFPVNFNIAFSLDFNEGLNSGNYFDQIKKNLQNLIKQSKLDKNIIVKDFSDIRKFKNISKAEKFREDKEIDLIIWGGFTNDNLKIEGVVINKINLNFTFGHPNDKKNVIGKMIKMDISSKFARKNYWQIIESNSFRDINIISNNIFHISTYILALSLKLFGKIQKSLQLFENLYYELKKLNDDFSNQLIPHLINCYDILAIENGLSKKDYIKANTYCSKILKFNEKNMNAIANLAVFNYHLGNKTESEYYVKLLQKYYPRNPITELDLAFIRILEGNYRNAYKHYERLIKYKTVNFNSQEVVEFLSFEYDRSKDPALLYASGIVSYYFGDRIVGKQDLRLFLKKAKKHEYKSMKNKAIKLIKN